VKRHLVLLFVLVGCGKGSDAPGAGLDVPVSVATIKRDSIAVYLEADGRILPRPDGAAHLTAPADAIVSSVRTAFGQKVAAGATLIVLSAPDIEGQAAALHSQALVAAANAERQRQLLSEGIAARRQVEEEVAAAEALSAQAAAAASLRDRLRVRTPLAGVISALSVSPGERVAAGQALVDVVDPARIRAVATIPAAQLAALKPGQAATLRVAGAPTEFPATVEQVGATVDTLSNTAQVVVHPRVQAAGLRPGVGVTLRIRVLVHHNVLIVPASALVLVGSTPTIFVVGADTVARARAVVVVARTTDWVEVTGDVHAGDKVVTVGAYGLPDSAHVTIRPDSVP
jgi:cobalt-zinc-cadmium efflux system membrane fusion protein